MDTAPAKRRDNLRFPYDAAPAPGTLREVAPGVHWLRMPLPFALDHINTWVLDDGDGWTLVDTGINTPATRELWDVLFSGPLKDKPVKRLVCTHFHPDHVGLAGWLTATQGVDLWITDKEWTAAQGALSSTLVDTKPAMIAQYSRAGFEDIVSEAVAARGTNTYPELVSGMPATYRRLEDSITMAGVPWRVVIGEGHSPQHAGLYSRDLGVLISGDHVLPGISPNISVRMADPDADPLKAYLRTLVDYRALPSDTFVLPSHKLPFYGLHERIDSIIAHHHQRLDQARTACVNGATGADVQKVLFTRKYDIHSLHFAIGETMAHLNYLVGLGDVVRERPASGADRYVTVKHAA